MGHPGSVIRRSKLTNSINSKASRQERPQIPTSRANDARVVGHASFVSTGQAEVWLARLTVTVSGGTAVPVLLTGLKVMTSCVALAVTRSHPEFFWSCLLRTSPVEVRAGLTSR